MSTDYKVLKITEMVRPGEVDGIEKFHRLRIKTKGNVILSVDIDERNFTAEKAAPILAKKALEADKILAL